MMSCLVTLSLLLLIAAPATMGGGACSRNITACTDPPCCLEEFCCNFDAQNQKSGTCSSACIEDDHFCCPSNACCYREFKHESSVSEGFNYSGLIAFIYVLVVVVVAFILWKFCCKSKKDNETYVVTVNADPSTMPSTYPPQQVLSTHSHPPQQVISMHGLSPAQSQYGYQPNPNTSRLNVAPQPSPSVYGETSYPTKPN